MLHHLLSGQSVRLGCHCPVLLDLRQLAGLEGQIPLDPQIQWSSQTRQLRELKYASSGTYNPPALGWLTLNAFTASDKVLVVVSPGYFELDSLVQLGKTVEEVREYFNPDLALLGYLFTMSEPNINASTSLQILRQTYTQKVLRTVIPRNTDLRDAHFNKTDIYSFNPRAKAALAYEKLIREVSIPDLSPAKTDTKAYEETA